MTKSFQLYIRFCRVLLLRLIYDIHDKWYDARWNILSSRLKKLLLFKKNEPALGIVLIEKKNILSLFRALLISV